MRIHTIIAMIRVGDKTYMTGRDIKIDKEIDKLSFKEVVTMLSYGNFPLIAGVHVPKNGVLGDVGMIPVRLDTWNGAKKQIEIDFNRAIHGLAKEWGVEPYIVVLFPGAQG